MKTVFVKIESENERLKDKTFEWSEDEKELLFCCAINFADGLVQGLELNGWRFGRPLVQPVDGYQWWASGVIIKVVNENGKIIRKPEDI